MAGEVPTLQVRALPLDADMTSGCGHGLWRCGHGLWRCGHGLWRCGHALWRCGHGWGGVDMPLEVRTWVRDADMTSGGADMTPPRTGGGGGCPEEFRCPKVFGWGVL
jgi:hypothetical protein